MTTREACLGFATLLRSVADGAVAPRHALARVPDAFGLAGIPGTWGSAVHALETFAADVADMGEHLPPEMRRFHEDTLRKLADRLEQRAPSE